MPQIYKKIENLNNFFQWFCQQGQNSPPPQRATVSYLEAKVRDDGWETVRPEQRHHQLLQALVNLKVLPEEWRHKETTISKRQWKWVWMISHGFYIRLFSCRSEFWNSLNMSTFYTYLIISNDVRLLDRYNTHSSPPWATRRAQAAAGLADVHPQSRRPPEYPAGSSSGRLLPGTLYTAANTYYAPCLCQ